MIMFGSKKYDYLIVGSGIFGATFAHLAKQWGKKCLVLERRDVVGGNCYTKNIDGINVHMYGPHIFHTNNKDVWDFVNSLVEFNDFKLNVLANYNNKIYHLPFNMNTFYELRGITSPEDAMRYIEVATRDEPQNPKNLEEQAIKLVGCEIYNTLIKGYTEKQWGRDCKDLPSDIIKRLPIRYTFDNNYFKEGRYQGVPKNGYTELFKKLLNGIEVQCGVDYLKNKKYYDSLAKKVVYTGKVDEYFNYCYGELEYRTVKWDMEHLENTPNFQGAAVINYTNKDVPFTRIIEHKHFDTFGDDVYKIPKTIISREYSVEWKPGMEGYYPIKDARNTELYNRYKALCEKEKNVIFGGRLAEYQYYDMNNIIENLLKIKETI